MKRLILIADHSFAVRTMRTVLQHTGSVQVVRVLNGSRPLDSSIVELSPDTVLIDDLQNRRTVLQRVAEASALLPDASRVLLTSRMDVEWLDDAFDAGADAAIFKTLEPAALGMLLRETLRGNIVHRLRRPRPDEAACPLTSREVEILCRVAKGHTNSRIASELWVTEQTVKFHLRNTYRKLGVANRTEATRYAYLNALVTPDEELAS